MTLSGRQPALALDGELLEIEPPLEVRVRKRALTVVLPPSASAAPDNDAE